jgi:hypothetical protein
MKYFFALSFLLIAGCSHPTGTIASQIPPYSPGGEYYVAPGSFPGTWINTTVMDSGIIIADTNLCTIVIKESDSLLAGTLTNNSTKEIINLMGVHSTESTDGIKPLYAYSVNDSSSFGINDWSAPFVFFGNGDSLIYQGQRELPRSPTFYITCIRIK